MPIYRINGRNLLFIHIPKTGGSTIEKWLGQLAPAGCLQRTKTGLCPCPAQHLHAAALQELFPPGFFDLVFSIVRRPDARIRSEYFWRMSGKKIRHGLLRRGPTFETASTEAVQNHFDGWLKNAFKEQRNDPYYKSNHIRPQHEFTAFEGCRSLRFEDGLDAAVLEIAQALNVPPPDALPHEKKTRSPSLSLSDAQLRRIRTFYAEDYRTFGYED